MAMKDESQLALQVPAGKEPTKHHHYHHQEGPALANGLSGSERLKRSNNSGVKEEVVVEGDAGEQGGSNEQAVSEGPTTRSDTKSASLSCCMKCDTEHSDIWHTTSQGIVLCSTCAHENSSTRQYKNRVNCKRINSLHSKKMAPKGAKKNKDSKLKKSYKLPYKEATYITSNQIYYKGVRYKVGDVFSIRDEDRLYYVCIRSFLEDPLCNQYAVIIWLLPLYPNPVSYNPHDFLMGPAEDVPRPLDCLSFVSHDPPQGHITLNELRCYDDMPELWEGRKEEPRREVEEQGKSGLDLLLEAMEPDIHKIR